MNNLDDVHTQPRTNIGGINFNNNNQDEIPNQQQQPQNQFGAVRDRLFHAMLVKVALSYDKAVSRFWRRILETFSLLTALSFLSLLLFVHLMSSRATTTCFDNLVTEWPKDGVIRLEVIQNLKVLEFKEKWIDWYKVQRSQMQCHFNPRDVLLNGPQSIPAEIRQRRTLENYSQSPQSNLPDENPEPTDSSQLEDEEPSPLLSYFLRVPYQLLGGTEETEENVPEEINEEWAYAEVPEGGNGDPLDEAAEIAFSEMWHHNHGPEDYPESVYRVEYSLYYGLLRLPLHYRKQHKIPMMNVRLDAESECFGDGIKRATLRWLIGYEEAVMTSLRRLAANASIDDGGLGYLHNLDTNEHFHFVTNGMSKTSYVTAAVVMVIFTFAISLLLRFSHHQIFVFIVDLLHMFELNQPLQFPAAPLLTVILALVGMEAIMSEVFADTTTAFYVILVVWIADQFDAICCHSPTSKRFWLRFFYLYQFFFYSYQYRFGGQYGGIALVTSALFILHSMVFFFHHYEMPLILYQDRLQRILSEIQTAPPMMPASTTQSATVVLRPVAVVPATTRTIPVDIAGNSRTGEETQQRNPSSVFDARSPPESQAQSPSAESSSSEAAAPVEMENAEEQVAREVVAEAIDELFQA